MLVVNGYAGEARGRGGVPGGREREREMERGDRNGGVGK